MQITAAAYNGCGFCVAGHTKLAYKKLQQLPQELVEALRGTQALSDPRLNALAAPHAAGPGTPRPGTRRSPGRPAPWPGYGDAQALDVVLGVSLALTLCNYANNLARTPINPELQAYA
ncbi:Macrophage infectivity potentiator OS=Castellaniella defragrans (strain DSM / CCUG 39792 / 65Phen)OX=1437824 GN=BN940_11291 PE=4 SV=1 [Castellaniella denitrificans]